MVVAFIILLFLDSLLRGSGRMPRMQRRILICCCAGLGLVMLIVTWPAVSAVDLDSLKIADFLSAPYIYYVLVLVAATIVAQVFGFFIGRRLTAFVTRGDTA